MQVRRVGFDEDFAVVAGNARAQAAVMVLAPGDSEGGPGNRHRGSDQWLHVVAGEGVATVEGQEHALGPGTLLLIERGETHEVRNTGSAELRTISFYVPPAYDAEGDPLPSGES